MTAPNKIFPYTVTRFDWITPKVFRIDVTPKDGKTFVFKAGQFVMLRLYNAGGTFWKQKAFTICSTPRTAYAIELGLKLYGEFTNRAAKLNVGDSVEIAGPYGVFTLPETATNVVMLAGGIGITPFLSMMRSVAEEHRFTNITLLYSNPTEESIAYRKELDVLAQHNPHLNVLHFITREQAPEGLFSGRINAKAMEQYCPVTDTTTLYYLCGPVPFMQEMTLYLMDKGVERKRIKMERF